MKFSLRILIVVMLLSGPVMTLPWWIWHDRAVRPLADQPFFGSLRWPALFVFLLLTATAIFAKFGYRPSRTRDN